MRAPRQVLEQLLQEMIYPSSPCKYCPLVGVAGARGMPGCEGPLGRAHMQPGQQQAEDDKLLHTNPNFACGYTARVPSAVSGTVLGKSRGANST